jgi:hypothetical protein
LSVMIEAGSYTAGSLLHVFYSVCSKIQFVKT